MKPHNLLCAFVFLLPGIVFASEIKGKVIRVLDGDTIEVLQDSTPVRIRLLNIDAPEKKQPFGRWSGEQLKALIASQPVTVTYDHKDRYGRILGRVVAADGTEANRYMVQQGAAWVYGHYNTDKALPAIQQDARASKRGLWAESNPVPPWEWRHSR